MQFVDLKLIFAAELVTSLQFLTLALNFALYHKLRLVAVLIVGSLDDEIL